MNLEKKSKFSKRSTSLNTLSIKGSRALDARKIGRGPPHYVSQENNTLVKQLEFLNKSQKEGLIKKPEYNLLSVVNTLFK